LQTVVTSADIRHTSPPAFSQAAVGAEQEDLSAFYLCGPPFISRADSAIRRCGGTQIGYVPRSRQVNG
jgi:hypothetical protein